MGQHFLFHRELVAATAVHHAVHARLTSDAQRDLVLVGPQWLRVYRVEPFQGADESKRQVLHMVAAFQLAGVAESVRVLQFDRGVLRRRRRAFLGGQDVLLLSFARYKWVIVGFDRRARSLATLAMFSFAEDAIGPGTTLKAEKNGREQLLGIATEAVVRVDPQTRCGAMLVYADQLIIVPFRSESMELSFFEEEDDEDDEEEEDEDGSKVRNGKDGAAQDDGDEDEDEDDEEKKLEELVKESKQRGNDAVSNKLMTLLDKSVKVGAKRKRNDMSGLMPNEIAGREFLLRLRELEICGKVVDMAFLDGYLEPTLMILHEENDKISTAGRLATGYDTYCLTVISINLNTRLHPKIWSVRNLPSDSFRLIPCRAPLGGVVVLSANAILYFNQTQFYGIATNIFATKTVNQSVYPLEDAVYETPDQQVNPLNVVLFDCEYSYLGQKEILLALPTGQLFALGLPYDDMSARSYGFGSNAGAAKIGLSLKLLHSGVSMNCVTIDEERKTLFVGSRSGDSVLFAFEEDKSASEPEKDAVKVEGDNSVASKEEIQSAAVPDVKDDIKQEMEDVEEDEDDLFLYGSAPTTSTSNGASTTAVAVPDEKSSDSVKVESVEVSETKAHEAPELNSCNYSLSPIDRLTGVGQITSLELGVETNVDSNEKREQLVASGGYLQDGAISVLHHGLRPIVGTEAELNGCRAMWTVSSSLDDARKSDDGRIYSSYLILSIGQRTMVLRTGEGMDPLEDNSGFYTSGPTLAAANLFGKQRIIQVFKQGARVMMEVPAEEDENKEEKPIKSEGTEGSAANGEGEEEDEEDDEDDGPQVKLVCTQEITLEGDVESGGMNVDTSSVGIVSVDVIDPFILLLLTDGTVRLLMGDDDMELTVIDPESEIYSSGNSSNGSDTAPAQGISAACLFYDWAGMFQDNAWGEDEREERNDEGDKHDSEQKHGQASAKSGNDDGDEDMDDLYTSKPSPRFKSHHAVTSSGSRSSSGSTAAIDPDSSVSVPLLARSTASMMCALCFEDGSLHVFSLPDFKRKGIFPYLTFAPQRLVNTMEHYQANRKKTVRFAAPVLGLNASSASANEGRIKKSHTINSPVADITIHRVGPAEGQHNSQYFARMVLLVFLANGDLLMYAATPKMGNPRINGAVPTVVSFQFVRIGSDLITRPFLPPRAKSGTTHNETGNNPEANTSAVLAKLRAGFRYSMLTRFNNINSMSGAFFRGAHPMWILSERGYPMFVPMCVPPVAPPSNNSSGATTPRLSVPVLSFTPFHHWNCPNGFIYFHSRGALRVCELPSSRTSTILPLSRGFVLHKAELGVTIHKLLFLGNRGPGGVAEALETPTYALVCSRRLPMAEAERATEHENPEDEMEEEVPEGEEAKSNVMAPTAEMFPDIALEDLPMSEEDVYELRLVQTNEFGEWNARTGVFRVHFDRYEVVLSVQLMYLYDSALMREDISSRSSEWARKKRPYLVVGTGYVGPHGEDESGRGRLLLYELDYAQYVNDDGSGATSSKLPKLRLVFIKEHRQGAISSVTQLGPYVLAAVGSKLIVYEFKSEQLIGCAFYDAQTFIVSLSVVRGDFVVYADVYKSAHFLRWREMQRQLVLLAKDYEPLAVTATEFSVFERKLALLATDMEENLHVMQFAPHDVESRGGQRLLRTADFHLGVQVIAMLRKRVDVTPTTNVCYVNLLGSSEGSLAALVPVAERVFRRLFTLQNVMINTLPQNCALNPRDFRSLKSNSQRHSGRPDAWTKHKWKKSFLDALVLFRFLHLDYVAQKELARCIGTTPEVVMHNLLEVQRATATFL